MDWDGLTLTEVPQAVKGQQLLTTIGKSPGSKPGQCFRNTVFQQAKSLNQVLSDAGAHESNHHHGYTKANRTKTS